VRLRLAVLLTVLDVLCGVPLHAAPKPSEAADRATIIAGERAWGQAYVRGDTAAVRALLAEDFRGIDPQGHAFGKADVLADVAALPHSTADRVDDVVVRFYGDTAVAQAHEHESGPAPERRPMDRMFTDTWIRRAGRWQIVASEDLDPGLASLPEHRADIAAIRAARAANNAAIAGHDMGAFLPMYADDAVFTWSNGSSAMGKPALSAFFARDFGDAAFQTYIRAPSSISISDRGVRAAEHGHWTALKAGTRYGGDYLAHWAKGANGWQVRGETYVKLYCEGPLCTP